MTVEPNLYPNKNRFNLLISVIIREAKEDKRTKSKE